jgi:hypothetical protein
MALFTSMLAVDRAGDKVLGQLGIYPMVLEPIAFLQNLLRNSTQGLYS